MRGDIEIEIKVEGSGKERSERLFDALKKADVYIIKIHDDKRGILEYKGVVWSKFENAIDFLVYTTTDDEFVETESLFIKRESDIREVKRVINTIIEGCKRP